MGLRLSLTHQQGIKAFVKDLVFFSAVQQDRLQK